MKEMGRRVRMFSFYFLHRADKIEGCRHSSNPPPFEKGGVFLGYQKWRGVSRIWKLRGYLFRSGHLIFQRGLNSHEGMHSAGFEKYQISPAADYYSLFVHI